MEILHNIWKRLKNIGQNINYNQDNLISCLIGIKTDIGQVTILQIHYPKRNVEIPLEFFISLKNLLLIHIVMIRQLHSLLTSQQSNNLKM